MQRRGAREEEKAGAALSMMPCVLSLTRLEAASPKYRRQSGISTAAPTEVLFPVFTSLSNFPISDWRRTGGKIMI